MHYFNLVRTSVVGAVFGILTLIAIGCNTFIENDYSYWETQKGKFKHSYREEFVSDSSLRYDVGLCHRARHKSLDSLFIGDKVYLYSWQYCDSVKNCFTIAYDDGELGLKIYYLICDKSDNLISISLLAGAG